MAHYVIYVPGIGDHMSYGQNIDLQLWRLVGLRPHYFPLKWADKEPFEPKLKRLLGRIDELRARGHRVSLVGVSAGASAVLNAYAQRKDLVGVICIVGKLHNPRSVGKKIYDINPAFKDSMALVAGSLASLSRAELARILSIYTPADKTVPPQDSQISGGTNRKFLGWGHISGIFFAVIFGGPLISAFLRRQSIGPKPTR